MAIPAAAWRALSIFLTLVIFLQFYLIVSHDSRRPSLSNTPAVETITAPQVIAAPQRPSSTEWQFDTQRDANNPALTTEQCDAAFPDLYSEIDRAVDWWKERNMTITPDDTSVSWRNDAAMRLLIHNNQLRVLEDKNTWNAAYKRRTLSTLHQIHRALLGASAAGEILPDIEFAVTVDDMAMIPFAKGDTHTIWSFTRDTNNAPYDRVWVMPDFNFWANQGASFAEMAERARAHDEFSEDKIPQAVWRGVRWTNEYVRGHLLDATKGKPWADVREMNWEDKEGFMAMEDFCRYAFVVHTEGRSWSGRLKYILNCNSVPVVHKLDWMAYGYHLLVPSGRDQNHVAVKRDFSDLERQVKRLLKHPKEAQRVADNAVRTFRERYMTLAAESCYWRRMVRGYSEVMAWRPEGEVVREVEVGGEVMGERVVRGMSFEGMATAPEEDVLEWMKEVGEG